MLSGKYIIYAFEIKANLKFTCFTTIAYIDATKLMTRIIPNAIRKISQPGLLSFLMVYPLYPIKY